MALKSSNAVIGQLDASYQTEFSTLFHKKTAITQ